MECNWCQSGEEFAVKDLTTSELAELRQAFDSVDRNGDGSIASSEFRELFHGIAADLKTLFATNQSTFVFTASGTGVMQAALENCVAGFR